MTDVRLRFAIEQTGVREANAGLDALDRNARESADSVDRLSNRASAAGGAMRALGTAVGIAVAALGTREILQAVDAYQRAQNQLRLATQSTEEFTAANEALFGVSQRTFGQFNATVDLYARLARSTQDVGATQRELVAATETINQLVALSGTSAEGANAALFQLGQGLAANALRGEELNSVLEQTPALARAIAAGVGVGLGDLRRLAEQGALTAEVVLNAIQSQADETQAAFERLEPTLAQVFTVVSDAFSREFVSGFNDELAETGSIILQAREAAATLGDVLGQAFAIGLRTVNQLAEQFETLSLLIDRVSGRRIDIDVDLTNVDAVRDQLLRVENSRQALERRVFNDVAFAQQPRAEDVAELARLEQAAEELRAILTNQVSPAANDFSITANDLGRALRGLERETNSATRSLSDQRREQAEAARAAQAQTRAEVGAASSIAERRINEAVRRELRRGDNATIGGLQAEIARELSFLRNQSQAVRDEANRLGLEALEDFPRLAREQAEATREQTRELRRFRADGLAISLDSISRITDGIAGAFDAAARVLLDPNASSLDIVRVISGGFGAATRTIGDELGNLSQSLGDSLGPILQAAGAAGQIASAAISIVQTITRLFGTQSSGGTFDLAGGVSFERTSTSPERNRSRNEIGRAAIEVAERIADLTGGTFAEGVGIRIFIDANDRLLASLRDLTTNAAIALPAGVTSDSAGNTADPQVAIRQGVNLLIANALEGGEAALVSFARAAASADIETEDLIAGIEALQNVFSLTAEPLSQIEQQLRAIDDAVAPAVAALEAVGQSIDDITAVASQAARAVGEAFIRDVQDQILREQNSTLANYRRLLNEIQQRQDDALALFERGAITIGELESVQFLAALQSANFFRNLSPEDAAELGDFFGILGDEVGQASVALARLEIEIQNFTESTLATAERLQSEIVGIRRALDGVSNVRADILREFSGNLPQENIAALSTELRGILGEVSNPLTSGERIESLLTDASSVARSIIDTAAETFGPTAAFAAIRDATTALLADIIDAGEDRLAERVTELETLQAQVVILEQIRDAVASPELSLPFIQQQLDEGRITNAILRDLLTQFVTAANVQAAALDPAALQRRSDDFLAAQTQQSFQIAAQDISTTIIRADQSRQASDARVIALLEQIERLQEQSNADQRDLLDRLRLSG